MDFRISLAVIFRIDEVLIKFFSNFFDLPADKTNAEDHFFSPTQENLDNPEKSLFQIFGFSSGGQKKWIADFESTNLGSYTPKNIY